MILERKPKVCGIFQIHVVFFKYMWYFSSTLYPKHISIFLPLAFVTIPLTTKTKIGREKAMVIARSIYLVEVILNLEAWYAIVYRKTEIRETADMFS